MKITALLVLMAAALPVGAGAAELVMVRRDGCPYCAQWDREIGPIYPKTDLGRRLPLRMVTVQPGGRVDLRTRGPIRYTPTFLLVENGQELGRIEGYPGDTFFWPRVEALLERLPQPLPGTASAPPAQATPIERKP